MGEPKAAPDELWMVLSRDGQLFAGGGDGWIDVEGREETENEAAHRNEHPKQYQYGPYRAVCYRLVKPEEHSE
jgi:hypothetical protein